MIPKKIYNDRPDIKEKVMEVYPVTKKERRGCQIEKARNEGKRFELAKRLYQGKD